MPLIHGKSKAAFNENVSEMIHSGHPLKQSLAAAYSEKRKAERRRKLWRGGQVDKLQMSEEDLERRVRDAEDDDDDEDKEEERFSEGGQVSFSKALRARRYK